MSATGRPERARRLLIVDDDRACRRLAALTMAGEGWACDEADSVPAARARLAEATYDCVLLDISMPEVSGAELCAEIRRDPALAQLRIVAFTAHAMPDELHRIMAVGFNAVVVKPSPMDALIAAIEDRGRPAAAGA